MTSLLAGLGTPTPVDSALADELVGRTIGLMAGYGSTTTLGGIDLEIRRGELVGVTGENGAGKSTLLRCLAGDLTPLAGSVELAPSAGVRLAWQHSALCDNLDIAQNLFLGRERRWRPLSTAPLHRRARSVLTDLDLVDELSPTTDLVGRLSRSRRQLLSIARAAAPGPGLLLLDEPSASLGVADAARVERLVQDLHRGGTSVLLVSRDVEQLFRVADRIVVLRKGRVAGEVDPVSGHPDDIAALVAGQQMDTSAHHQLSRLHALTDRLASADPSSIPVLILSALAAALGAVQLVMHVATPEGGLRLLGALGLPADVQRSWATLPAGSGGGPIGLAFERAEAVVDADVRVGAGWQRWRDRLWRLRIASSWAVPFYGSEGLGGVITVFRDRIGSPTRSELDLAVLYGGYAANALERDRLVGELTSRNRVLETIRDVLETLSAPVPITAALRTALQRLVQGVRADGAAVFSRDPGAAGATCLALVTAGAHPVHEIELAAMVREHPADASGADFPLGSGRRGRVVGLPGAQTMDWLVVVCPEGTASGETGALVDDAAHSVRLALERDRAEQAAQEAAALRRSRELQRDFLARLSHELRTPLTAIGGYADSLLQRDVVWDADSRERFLSRIVDESRRLGRLVEDLLDHSAIDSGVLRLQRDWSDLALVVDAARACLGEQARGRVDVAVPEDLPPIWADHDRLEQVFVNLFDNAIRHNPPGTRVWVSLLPAPAGRVVVAVRDDGTGDPGRLSRDRRPPDRRGRGTGAGLGLSIARAIVAAHGGGLVAEPADPGVRFVITLPTEPEDDEPSELGPLLPGEGAVDG